MQLHAPNDTHLLTKTKEDEEEVQQQDEENDTSKDEEDKLANLQISDAEVCVRYYYQFLLLINF